MFASRPSACGSAAKARGFTLIEVVAAFAVLVLGLGLVMQIATGGLRQARQAAEYTEVSLLAQSLLDTVGVGERIELGATRGEWEGGYRWELTVSPYQAESESGGFGIDPMSAPVQLVELELAVSWERNRNTREMRYLTLRAMLPENL